MMLFENRNMLIVTKHGKEEVLQPILEQALKVKCLISNDFDTDSFGTFSGEIARKEDALVTIRKKCLAAMAYYDCDLAVASEGSFGPHPSAFFASADDELILLIDLKNDLEIIGRKLSLETNFSAKSFTDLSSFFAFLQQIQFPSHHVILKDKEKDPLEIHKDFKSQEEVVQMFHSLFEKYGTVFAETDMRAMNNPTRMKIIKESAENLVEKTQSLCPKCQFPGFSVTSAVAGLPCECCNFPTKSTLYHVLKCTRCNFEEKKYFPRNVSMEEPMYCDNCNP
jgi:hypothetical protein